MKSLFEYFANLKAGRQDSKIEFSGFNATCHGICDILTNKIYFIIFNYILFIEYWIYMQLLSIYKKHYFVFPYNFFFYSYLLLHL